MGGFTKNQYRGERFPKKEFANLGGGAWQEMGEGFNPPFPALFLLPCYFG